ncbi:MAG: hypothetical protein IH899_02640, partial [Planctomycetes bacterium]|nr:hypothetical protein [Planctomycetota bacterium]
MYVDRPIVFKGFDPPTNCTVARMRERKALLAGLEGEFSDRNHKARQFDGLQQKAFALVP